MQNKSNSIKRTKVITGCGLLIAVAVVLQYVEFPIPIIPSFIKLDFSDLPEIIGAFAYGPLAGVIIALVKNVIHMAVSQSGFVGELSNFVLGATFALVAGLIYKRNKTKKTAIIAGFSGALAMAAVSLPLNYFAIYPLYYSILNFPEPAVLGMYQAILPSTKNMLQALLIFNVPFTLVKGVIDVVFCILIYKPLSPVLKGKKSE
jgi:riboflavin transporter FmnP